MKILIAEDDFTSRVILQELLKSYGVCHVAVNGKEAVGAVRAAMEARQPYDLICLDIMMPELSGQEALRVIRLMESRLNVPAADGAKIIMTTSVADEKNIRAAREQRCDAFLVKPIQRTKLEEELSRLGLGDRPDQPTS
jgi:two-component system chemotaxis response regulator CheY